MKPSTASVVDLACYMLDKGNRGPPSRPRLCVCAGCAKEAFRSACDGEGTVYHVSGGLAAKKKREARPAQNGPCVTGYR